ncbi:efflux RND transporter periplasmic adaptor subunit [Hydrogenimonas thermophila]|uniref:efflux RND transporter periplasmic adaptor subunit n=2 Tax=Hydrogenimonas thermophila TaxID=223786 RepID=UPI002936F893|nr:efflux RND transporter periplasmic adaptor subunit [Hydrogenimonas thermophila]WOE69966.1 efflux RND transporter periplasmic adaptor subunit [Hydrogenimonas thermophila]
MNNPQYILILILTFCNTLFALSSHHVKVSVVEPKKAELPIEVKVRGIVEAEMAYGVNTQAEGILHNHVINAQKIEKGNVIAILENPQLKKSIGRLKEQIELIQNAINIENKKLKSAKEMLDLGIISNNDYLSQQNRLNSKKLELTKAKNKLEKMTIQYKQLVIKAPFSGFVTELKADGSYIGYGGYVCKIQSQNMQVRLFVPHLFAKKLYTGETVSLKVDDQTIKAKIVEILPKTTDNLVNVIAKPNKPLPANLNIEADIMTKKISGWIIPKQSIVLIENRPAIFIIERGFAKLHFITIQKDMVSGVLVSDRLSPSNKIVLKNAYMLHDGIAVEIVK